jgi:hypothetical protein
MPGRDRDVGLLDQQLGEFQRRDGGTSPGSGTQANIEAAGTGISQPALPKLSTSTSRRRL